MAGVIEIADEWGNTLRIVYSPTGVKPGDPGSRVGAQPKIVINGHDVELRDIVEAYGPGVLSRDPSNRQPRPQ